MGTVIERISSAESGLHEAFKAIKKEERKKEDIT